MRYILQSYILLHIKKLHLLQFFYWHNIITVVQLLVSINISDKVEKQLVQLN